MDPDASPEPVIYQVRLDDRPLLTYDEGLSHQRWQSVPTVLGVAMPLFAFGVILLRPWLASRRRLRLVSAS